MQGKAVECSIIAVRDLYVIITPRGEVITGKTKKKNWYDILVEVMGNENTFILPHILREKIGRHRNVLYMENRKFDGLLLENLQKLREYVIRERCEKSKSVVLYPFAPHIYISSTRNLVNLEKGTCTCRDYVFLNTTFLRKIVNYLEGKGGIKKGKFFIPCKHLIAGGWDEMH